VGSGRHVSANVGEPGAAMDNTLTMAAHPLP
jgi:hypothetical protein